MNPDEDPLSGIRFVDCDAHFSEPADLWSARMPKSSRVRIPELRTVDGESNWYLGDELFTTMGGNSVRQGRQRVHGVLSTIQPYEDLDESTWSVPARLRFMDEIGVLAQVVYPNGIGFSSNYIFALEDMAERVAILQAYNDFYVDVQHQSGGRLLPQAMLPIWDMEFTVKEMTRLVDEGVTGFCMSDRPELLGLPELSDPYFDPMWDVFNESGTVANFHLAAGATKAELEGFKAELEAHRARAAGEPVEVSPDPGRGQRNVAPQAWLSLPPQRRLAASTSQFFMSNARIMCNLCVSDLFDRFPKLKIMSAESGIGWVPFVLESLEYHFDDMVVDERDIRFAKRRPKEYFADHIYVTFWFEHVAPQKLIEDIGIRNVMVETDFPHPTCLFPETRERLASSLVGLTPELKTRLLRDNAVDLYGIKAS
jgi:predicted TIM-barrel fold metal-dependent hydrolase